MGEVGLKLLNDKLLLEEQSKTFGLTIFISSKSYMYFVTGDKQELLAYSFVFPNSDSAKAFNLGFLIQNLNQDKITKLNVRRTVLIHGFPMYKLVPKSLYQLENKSNYLEIKADQEQIFSNTVSAFGEKIELVHSIPKRLINGTARKYVFHTVHHIGECLLKSSNQIKDKNYAHCLILESSIYIKLVSAGKLQGLLKFEYQSPEDLLYFLGLSLSKLNFNVQKSKIYLSGLLTDQSQLVKIIRTYYSNVSFFNTGSDDSNGQIKDPVISRMLNLVGLIK